jgi:hypothetical protein
MVRAKIENMPRDFYNTTDNIILTFNVPLIWKVREIIFFSGQNS